MRQAAIFYTVFTVVYGLMHLLVLTQAGRALALSNGAFWALAAWFAAMALSPLALGLAGEHTGAAAFAAFAWMGLVFYLFLGSFVLALVSGWLPPAAHRTGFLLVVAASLAASAYGLANARSVAVRELEIATAKLPPGRDTLRIAVISDLHLYSVEQGARLDRVLPVLAGLHFDILVSLGDLIESGAHLAPWREEAARLAAVRAPLGKFAVGGNHELFADLTAGQPVSRRFHEEAGFVWLDAEAVVAGGAVRLAGVDYPRGGPKSDVSALAGLPRDLPVVFLKHVPTVDPEAAGLFDLQLSGHSHNGQLWPFTLLVKAFFPYILGLYDLGGGAKLYVSPGTGTWGPPMRVGSRAEITLVTLRRV